MKVKIHGFQIVPTAHIGLADFMSYIDEDHGQIINGRIFATAHVDDFWIGVVVTIKDAKAFCKIKQDGGTFKVRSEGLGDDRVADFNYFLVVKSTGRGIYQYHHLSIPLRSFLSILQKKHEDLSQRRTKAEIRDGMTKREKDDVEKRYSKSLGTAVMFRREEFLAYVKRLGSIRSVKFDGFMLEAAPDELGAVRALARSKSISERISFDLKQDQSFLKGAIETAIEKITKRSGKQIRIEGKDEHGIDQVYKFLNDHDVFDQFDYDEVGGSIEMDSNNLSAGLQDSPIMKKLFAVANGKAKTLLTIKVP